MAKIVETKKTAKNGSEITVCTPEVGAGAEILDVVKEIFAQSEHLLTEVDEFNYTVEDENEMIQSYLNHPDKVIIVPKIEGKIVGMMDFSVGRRRRSSHQGELGMSVHPRYQGLGVGRMMLNALIDWARENPRIETLRLKVHAKNKKAIALYQSVGFVEEGRKLKGVKFSDGSYDAVILMALAVK
jgi:RimJ/RimL family protein N-acetyltransferase